MLLSEIFDQLSAGEFASLALGNSDSVGITTDSYVKVIHAVNAALTELHKRFQLKTKEVNVQQYDAITEYILSREYAVNGGSTQPIKYVLDTPADPFLDKTLLKIERIKDELGEDITINDINDCKSYHTPSYNKIQVPTPNSAKTMGVIYRANHSPIEASITTDPNTVEVDISVAYLPPLLYFTASRLFIGRPSLDGQNSSFNYLSLYEAACKEIENYGIENNTFIVNTKPELNGWP